MRTQDMPEKDSKIDEVVSKLQAGIEQGEYAAGQRLPSERQLMDDFQMSRSTIRAALSRLQASNLIDILPRGGVIVRSPSARIVIGPSGPIAKGLELKRAGSFIRAMRAEGKETLVKFIEPSSVIPVGSELGEKMETSPETKVLRRYRLHLVDKVPYRILDSYYLATFAGDLQGKDEGYIPLFKWVREHTGKRAERAFEKLRCRMPSAEEASLLHIARNQPVFDMDRWVWADDGTLFEYSHIIENSALHEHTYSYDIEEEASK